MTRSGIGTPCSIVAAKTRIPNVTGLDRPRLTDRLADIWNYPAALVSGPAGYGKTTLLTQLAGMARASAAAVAWYQASASESECADFLRHLDHSLRSALNRDGTGASWQTVEEAARDLEAWADGPTLLVIDDLHVLAGTRAEAALEQLIAYLPPQVHLLAASREVPSWNMTRLRLSAMVLEITSDDMRFRLWEIDRLFRAHYRQPLTPEECAELERRTEGWAGGLALFHLATRGRSSVDRHRVLLNLVDRPRSLRDYLAQNVLAGLPDELHDFMVRTSVLGYLSGPLCDELLGRSHSEAMLREIERRQIFLTSTDDGQTWRFHEIMRSLLEAVLVETVGEESARVERVRAGKLLEAYGAWPDALRAYCRAEDWDSVQKLLGQRGQDMVEGGLGWLDVLPSALTTQDPWVLIAVARRHLAMGSWRTAIESYRSAEAASPGKGLASRCQRERLVLSAWFEPLGDARPMVVGEPEWAGRLRRGFFRDPLAAAGPHEPLVGDPMDLLARGTLAMVAGRPDFAKRLFEMAMRGGSDICIGLARIGHALAMWVTGEPLDAYELATADDLLRGVPVPFVAALGHAVVRGDYESVAATLAEAETIWSRTESPWFHAFCRLANGMVAVALMVAGRPQLAEDPSLVPESALQEAAQEFEALGADVLRSWALALLAAVRNLGVARDANSARMAVAASKAAVAPGAQLLAMRVLERTRAGSERGTSAYMAPEGVVDVAPFLWPAPTVAERPAGAVEDPAPRFDTGRGDGEAVEVQCFGRFTMTAGGEVLDVAGLRPKSRSLLRWLCVQSGHPLHRETIMTTLWPQDEATTATRKLHVVVSSLRQLFSPIETRIGAPLLVREGHSYRLAGPPHVQLDIAAFTRDLAVAEIRRARGEVDAAAASLEAALDHYRGELVPEEGPAEWIVESRERLRLQAADAIVKLVSLLSEIDSPVEDIIDWCERGLNIDRYSDDLWKRLIDLHEGRDDAAKAARLRLQYQLILAELGV